MIFNFCANPNLKSIFVRLGEAENFKKFTFFAKIVLLGRKRTFPSFLVNFWSIFVHFMHQMCIFLDVWGGVGPAGPGRAGPGRPQIFSELTIEPLRGNELQCHPSAVNPFRTKEPPRTHKMRLICSIFGTNLHRKPRFSAVCAKFGPVWVWAHLGHARGNRISRMTGHLPGLES